jgi:hypothetical protein
MAGKTNVNNYSLLIITIMKHTILLILLLGVAPLYAQPYVAEWKLDTMHGAPLSEIEIKPTITTGGAYRMYQTDRLSSRVYFNANNIQNMNRLSLTVENVYNNIASTVSPILMAGGFGANIILKGKNKFTSDNNSNPAFEVSDTDQPITITGTLADTFELKGGNNTVAIKVTNGGAKNSALVFNGGVILIDNTLGGGAIATVETKSKFDTIIVNRGVITSTDGRNTAIIGEYAAGNPSRMVVINGGTVDGILANEVIINGGSVCGNVYVIQGTDTILPTNSAGDTVFVGKLSKPNVEGVWVDDKNYNIRRNHNGNDTLYLYMTHADETDTLHIVNTIAAGRSTVDTAVWDETARQFVFNRPTHTIQRLLTDITLTAPGGLTRVYQHQDSTPLPLPFNFEIAATTIPDASPSTLPLHLAPLEVMIRFNGYTLYKKEDINIPPLSYVDNYEIASDMLKLPAGRHPITIEYGGDPNNSNSPNSIDTFLTIEKAVPIPWRTLSEMTNGTDTLEAQYLDTCKNIPGFDDYAQPFGQWRWRFPNDTVGSIGLHYVPIQYMPLAGDGITADTNNYFTIDTGIWIRVRKRTPESRMLYGVQGDHLYNIPLGDKNSCWQWVDSMTIIPLLTGTPKFSALYLCDTTHFVMNNEITITVVPEVIPAERTAVYLDLLSNIGLPPDWTWTPDTITVGNVGLNYHTATYAPSPSVYPPITTQIGVLVGKKRPAYNSFAPTAIYGDTLGNIPLWDTSAVARPALGEQDTCWTWASPADLVGNAGQQRHRAIFTPLDTVNFIIIDTGITVTVSKAWPTCAATPNFCDITLDSITATYLDILSSVRIPYGWYWDASVRDSTVGDAGMQYRRVFYRDDNENYYQADTIFRIIVKKKVPTIDVYELNTEVTYGDLIEDIEFVLPPPWVWRDPRDSVGTAGKQQVHIIVNHNDTANYQQTDRTLWIFVEKDTLDYHIPPSRLLVATYGDLLQTVLLWDTAAARLNIRDTGWVWATPNAKVGNVGVREHQARFVPLDTFNYAIVPMTLLVQVNKAKPNPPLPDKLAAFTGDTLQSVVLPAGWQWLQPEYVMNDRGIQYYNAFFTPQDTANWDTIVRSLMVFVVQKTLIEIDNATETKPTYFVMDSCSIDFTDIYFETDPNVTLWCTSGCRQRGEQLDPVYLGIDITKPDVYVLTYKIRISSDYDWFVEKEGTLYIERQYRFKDVVRQKYNKVLFVINNPVYTGYQGFVGYQWYRNGEPVGDGQQYYYEGTADNPRTLSPATPYTVKLTTETGKEIGTCPGFATSVASYLKIYPNPARQGGTITIDFPSALQSSRVMMNIFSISGNLVATYSLTPDAPQIMLGGNLVPGIYILKTLGLGETLLVIE